MAYNSLINEENKKVGQMLKNAREARGVTQAQMTTATGLTPNYISAVERGVSRSSVKMLLGYCQVLNMTPNQILQFDLEQNSGDLKLLQEFQQLSIENQQKALQFVHTYLM